MKTVCDFCKTEYTLAKAPNTPVRCAVCGHVWSPRKSFVETGAWIKFFVVICALIAACIFAFVVLVKYKNNPTKKQPLFARIDEKNIHLIKDNNGNNRIFVSGDITNNTMEIYGLPRIVLVSYDIDNNVLSRQTFIPPATFIDPKTTLTFNYTLLVDPANVKRVSVELKEYK